MARTAIKDQRFFIIGYIEDMTDGRQRALDFGFRIVGTGNQLAGLIEQAR